MNAVDNDLRKKKIPTLSPIVSLIHFRSWILWRDSQTGEEEIFWRPVSGSIIAAGLQPHSSTSQLIDCRVRRWKIIRLFSLETDRLRSKKGRSVTSEQARHESYIEDISLKPGLARYLELHFDLRKIYHWKYQASNFTSMYLLTACSSKQIHRKRNIE